MKNPERVATLLAELRTFAETDFERHRIDILERDLHEPPTVEVIDDKHQRFNGVVFHKDTCGGHFRATWDLHRAIYSYCCEDIPSGEYLIHHRDGNPANNSLENLQLVTKQEHAKIHAKTTQPQRKCKICGKMFTPAKFGGSRFCSEQCSEKAKKRIQQCIYCGKSFEVPRNFARGKKKYCSDECRRAALKARYGKNQ